MLIPIVGVAVYLGGAWLAMMMGLATLWSGWEYFTLLHRGGYQPAKALGLLFIALLLSGVYWQGLAVIRPVVTGVLILSLSWQLFQKDSPAPMVDWALTVSGGLYLGWMAGHFLLLRAAPFGFRWIVVALLSTWISDSGAYFIGRSFGRHKLWPRISPKKTWEGAVGGWVCGVALTPLVTDLLGLGWLHGALVGALVGIVAPFGDLAVSMLKRQVGAKDSGHLIPGHGGMLDRIDSLLFIGPLVYYYVRFVVGL